MDLSNRHQRNFGIDGVEFPEAWGERLETTFDGEPAHVLSRRHLVATKKSCGRLQDLADVERLEEIARAGRAGTAR